MMVIAAATTPSWDRYCGDREVAGPFENLVLYAMCRDNARHDDPYVTAGKVTAIGRIYAASPERGAGEGHSAGSLVEAIARRLANSSLDEKLEAIDFAKLFSRRLLDQVTKAHEFLVSEVAEATREWSLAGKDVDWTPRRHASFASKYLHFHRPNAFPIMDKFAKAGLVCAGLKGSFDAYPDFCVGILQHVTDRPNWTPRGIDTELVNRGRVHSDRTKLYCLRCNAKFVKRPRKMK